MNALPFISEFFRDAYATDISDLVFKSVHRELKVAADTASTLEVDGDPVGPYVVNTLSVLLRHHWGMYPEFVDMDGSIREEDERDYELAQQTRREFEQNGNDVDAEETCTICGADPLFVSFEHFKGEQEDVRAGALRCFRCGLNIGTKQKHLARFHYGPVESSIANKFLKNIGEL